MNMKVYDLGYDSLLIFADGVVPLSQVLSVQLVGGKAVVTFRAGGTQSFIPPGVSDSIEVLGAE